MQDLKGVMGKSTPLSVGTFMAQRELNDRLILAERGFLDAGGLEGKSDAGYRQWLKHLVL